MDNLVLLRTHQPPTTSEQYDEYQSRPFSELYRADNKYNMTISIGAGISIGPGITLEKGALGPTTIGEFYGGGYYAGQISTTANGVATHYLIVAPKAWESLQVWSTLSVQTGINSDIDGPGNTAALVALGTAYPAAYYCGVTCNASGGINGYTDWYLPATDESEVIYYFLKPDATQNAWGIGYGVNTHAVSPEPISQSYLQFSPTQTTVTLFQTGNAQAFDLQSYWASTEATDFTFEATTAHFQYMVDGAQYFGTKQAPWPITRPIRRIPV